MRKIRDPLHQISCVFFAYDAANTDGQAIDYCRTHNLTATFFVCRSDSGYRMLQKYKDTTVYLLDEIRNRKKSLL